MLSTYGYRTGAPRCARRVRQVHQLTLLSMTCGELLLSLHRSEEPIEIPGRFGWRSGCERGRRGAAIRLMTALTRLQTRVGACAVARCAAHGSLAMNARGSGRAGRGSRILGVEGLSILQLGELPVQCIKLLCDLFHRTLRRLRRRRSGLVTNDPRYPTDVGRNGRRGGSQCMRAGRAPARPSDAVWGHGWCESCCGLDANGSAHLRGGGCMRNGRPSV